MSEKIRFKTTTECQQVTVAMAGYKRVFKRALEPFPFDPVHEAVERRLLRNHEYLEIVAEQAAAQAATQPEIAAAAPVTAAPVTAPLEPARSAVPAPEPRARPAADVTAGKR
jgi:hypothetical protein